MTEAPKDTCVNGSKTCNKQIGIGHMNVEGLASKLCEPDFVKYMKSFYIFCAVETFTHFLISVYTSLTMLCSIHQQKKNFLNMEDDQEEQQFSYIKL